MADLVLQPTGISKKVLVMKLDQFVVNQTLLEQCQDLLLNVFVHGVFKFGGLDDVAFGDLQIKGLPMLFDHGFAGYHTVRGSQGHDDLLHFGAL